MSGRTVGRSDSSMLLAAMEKLDSRATELQGMKELREYLAAGGAAVLPELTRHLLGNLKRSHTQPHAAAECVTLLAEAAEAHPAPLAPMLPRIVGGVVKQLRRPGCRDACCASLARTARALSAERVGLAPFFSPLFASLAEPCKEEQEGAAAALRALVLQAAADDLTATLPSLLPRLSHALRGSLAKDAVLAALEASLNAAEPPLQLEHAPMLAATICRALGAPAAEFKTRAAAARCAVPLLGTLAPLEAAAAHEATAVLRVALEKVRYDRFSQARAMCGKGRGGGEVRRAVRVEQVRDAALQALREVSTGRSPGQQGSPPAPCSSLKKPARRPRPSHAFAGGGGGGGGQHDVVLLPSSPADASHASDASPRPSPPSTEGAAGASPPPPLLDAAASPSTPHRRTDAPTANLLSPAAMPRSPLVAAASPGLRRSGENQLAGRFGAVAEGEAKGHDDKENPSRRAAEAEARPPPPTVDEMLQLPQPPHLSIRAIAALGSGPPVLGSPLPPPPPPPAAADERNEFKENFSPRGTASARAPLSVEEARVLRVLAEGEEGEEIEVEEEGDGLAAALGPLLDVESAGGAAAPHASERSPQTFHSARDSAGGDGDLPAHQPLAELSPNSGSAAASPAAVHSAAPLAAPEGDDFVIFSDAALPRAAEEQPATDAQLRQALKRALDDKNSLARLCDEQRKMLASERQAHASELAALRHALHEERGSRQQLEYKCEELQRMVHAFR
ncbi:hypothetical protein AB1Y20_018827 [Prymnesium parvum]|uniref:TORTIFOLIA1/SINE1-2 N-terminal domain-containing protein n=1 Tax=Prymnesium parvum TaxID=97485 RepID=A0AB34JPL0_PRYPA